MEWNESEGAVKRTYLGLGKRSVGVVQFDTTKNRFLAAGDEFKIKYWDMDNVNLLSSIDADGGLPVTADLIGFNIYLLTLRKQHLMHSSNFDIFSGFPLHSVQ